MDDYHSPKRSDHEASSSKLQLQVKPHPACQNDNQNTMHKIGHCQYNLPVLVTFYY